MYCKNCGAEIPDSADFCTYSGQSVPRGAQNFETPAYEPSQVVYGQPEQPPVAQENLPNVLKWGILGLVFSLFQPSILGIIFSAIALSKANLWQSMTGSPLVRGGKVGRVFAVVGLVVGIVETVLVVLLSTVLSAVFRELFL